MTRKNLESKKIMMALATLAAAAGLLSGCGQAPDNTFSIKETQAESTEALRETAEAEVTKAEDAGGDYTGGTPWLNPMVPGNITEDSDIDLKDNFIAAVCKDFYTDAEIAAGYSCVDPITLQGLDQTNKAQELYATCDRSASHEAELAGNYYDLYLDWERRDELGMDPIREDIGLMEAIETIDDLNDYLLKTPLEHLPFDFFDFYADGDMDDSSKKLVYFMGPSLILEDSDYYRNDTEDIAVRVREAYQEQEKTLLLKYGYSEEEADEMIADCYEFEKYMAQTLYSAEEQNSPDYTGRIANRYSRDEMLELEGVYPMVEAAEHDGFNVEEAYVACPDALKALAAYYTDDHVKQIRSYMIVKHLVSNVRYLDRESYDTLVTLNGKIYGSQGKREDQVTAAYMTTEHLRMAAAKLYCDTYLTQEDKDRVHSLIDEIIAAYREMLSGEDFLSEETKAKAINKLDNITVNCLYPDDWSLYDYSDVEIGTAETGETVYSANMKLYKHNVDEWAKSTKEPVNKAKWESNPLDSNAYYYMADNSINILAGICGGELYDTEMTDEELYGALGYIIGHEISHAFDSTGAQYDENGNVSDWWTEEEKAAFDEKNRRLADYFSKMTAWEGMPINGSMLTGEAGADMGSVACILHIAKSKENFDYDAFFKSVANTWKALAYPEVMESQIQTDPHPLDYLRVNAVLQQFDEFYETYGIEEGDGMYLAPEDRVAIW